MAEFFLRKEKGRVLEFIENESGFVGRASDQDRASLPIVYAKYLIALRDFGADKAIAEAEAKGEWRVKEPPRPSNVLKRKIEAAKAEIVALHDELDEALALEGKEKPAKKVATKKKVTKKKVSSKKSED